MRVLGLATLSLLLVLVSAGTALPWGDAPTHFSIGHDLATEGAIAPGVDASLFVPACACPDIANTRLFKSAGLGYVHSLGFAEALCRVAERYSRADWLATGLGWGTHLASDELAHADYFPETQPVHSLAEVAVDTCIFYGGSPLGTPPLDWAEVNVGPDCCSPWLIYLASREFRRSHPRTRLVYPWEARMALSSLATSIRVEYEYIRAKGDTRLSERFLEDLVNRGILPGDWEPYYGDAVEAARAWIEAH